MLTQPLPAIPAVGAAVTDFTSGAATSIADPAAGASNSAAKLYLVIESVRPDTKHLRDSMIPAYADGAGG